MIAAGRTIELGYGRIQPKRWRAAVQQDLIPLLLPTVKEETKMELS
jgi:hypothetical protein